MKTYIYVHGYSVMLEVTKIFHGECIRGMAAGSKKEKYTKYFFKDYLHKKSKTLDEVCLMYHENDEIQPILIEVGDNDSVPPIPEAYKNRFASFKEEGYADFEDEYIKERK